MKNYFYGLLCLLAISFVAISCSNETTEKSSNTTQMVNKEGDGYSSLYKVNDSIPNNDVNHKDVLTFTNQLLDKYTIVDKDNIKFLPVDSSTIDTEYNDNLTAKPRVICHHHVDEDHSIHEIVVRASNGYYYYVVVYDGDWLNPPTVWVSSPMTSNPC